ncbi:DUF1302 domain-containing protein [Azospirillum sp. B510]|uniref:DUF1302 domain-containing protein n=1 Tax=Azospirillum sp. (strain B510) TaxID=137722 RepID=UPI000B34A4FA|nr:DUF1302 domain-containing protein [Azospirillum sp. B510]
MRRARRARRSIACAVALGAGTVLAVPAAQAFEIDSGNPEVKVRWDTTAKYSSAFRVKDASPTLKGSANFDDGDRNFDRGLISNRVDLLSEMDVVYRGFGVRLSGAGWYDTVYNQSNDNDSPLTANQRSVAPNRFTGDTRRLHGRNVELLDAFAFGKVNIDDTTASFRVGRYALQWGESLFFGANGVAAAMAPIDIVKAQSVPNTQFKELIRPVEQMSGQWQISPDLSIGAYYQFRWEENRFPGSGSYFSTSDNFATGAERMNFGPFWAGRAPDIRAKNSGQGGVQARFQLGETDFGLYAMQYHDKSPQPYLRGLIPGPNVPAQFLWVYPENIRTFGASFSHTIGIFNIAGEASMRTNMPLASDAKLDLFGIVPSRFGGPTAAADNNGNPLYAVGRTAHAQISWLASLPPSFVAEEASFLGELACNRVLKVTKNPTALNPNANRDACNLRMVYEPSYRQVLSGLDLSVPVGFGYGMGNSAALGAAVNGNKVGDLSIGLKGVYENTWQMGLSYTHYFGPEGTFVDANNHVSFKQSLKDRDFVAMTLSRTF